MLLFSNKTMITTSIMEVEIINLPPLHLGASLVWWGCTVSCIRNSFHVFCGLCCAM